MNGSSIIDLLVYREGALRGRRVFLDYRNNPGGRAALEPSLLDQEAFTYLQGAQALEGTPIDRLIHMNRPAYELYLSKGVDLKKERLEIALCAQHSNGGLDVDAWWQSNLAGLFVVGEAAGTHGVNRPGGSALNAGQVGALRAALFIASKRTHSPRSMSDFMEAARSEVLRHQGIIKHCVGTGDTAADLLDVFRSRMSEAAGAIRSTEDMARLLSDVNDLLDQFETSAHIPTLGSLQILYRLRDVLLTQRAYLYAMLDYVQHGGGSRGSAIYFTPTGTLREGLEERFRFQPDDGALNDTIQQITASGSDLISKWRPVRPLPEGGGFFETVWREFREHQNIY